MDATDEEDHAATSETEVRARFGAVAGREHRVVDTGRDDLDAIGLGIVERRELRALVVGRREHQVGARDDFVLDARAQLRIVLEPGVRFDARERVERRARAEDRVGA